MNILNFYIKRVSIVFFNLPKVSNNMLINRSIIKSHDCDLFSIYFMERDHS